MTTFQFREPLRQVPIFDHEGRKKYLFHSPEIPVCDLHGIVRLPGPESKHISRNDPEKNWHMRVFMVSLSRQAGIDPKLVADQLGHGLGVRIPRWQ